MWTISRGGLVNLNLLSLFNVWVIIYNSYITSIFGTIPYLSFERDNIIMGWWNMRSIVPRPVLQPTSLRIPGLHANHYNTYAAWYNTPIHAYLSNWLLAWEVKAEIPFMRMRNGSRTNPALM